MELLLDRLDLSLEYHETACSRVSFEHLTDKAQVTVIVMSKAVFWEFDHSNYNAVYTTRKEVNDNVSL